MNFIITLYRDGSLPQNFNATSIPEANEKMRRAMAATGARQVQLSVVLQTVVKMQSGWRDN